MRWAMLLTTALTNLRISTKMHPGQSGMSFAVPLTGNANVNNDAKLPEG